MHERRALVPPGLFWAWVFGGACWIQASGYFEGRAQEYPERTFRYVQPSPEQEQREREADRAAQIATIFFWGTLGYALVGVVAFRGRRGWALLVAVVICLLSWFAQAAVGLGRL